MAEAVFAIPGRIDTPTGGYEYDRRVMALMPSFGVEPTHLALPGSFPSPSDQDLAKSGTLLAETQPGAKLIVDGLALGVMPPNILEPITERLIALIHHPLAFESGLSQDRRKALLQSERTSLTYARHVIATSTYTRNLLAEEYAVPTDRITIAEPGTDPAPRATGTGTPLQLLAVGSIIPRKGYDILIEALAPLSHIDWRLTIAGADDRDESASEALRKQIAEAGLTERVTLAGVVVPATLARLYESADIFVMPTQFEGYGMALSEAMARGLTIVSTFGGAAAHTVPDDAALKVPPGDVTALNEALARVLESRKLRAQLADAAWESGRSLPTWNETARRVCAVVMGLQV